MTVAQVLQTRDQTLKFAIKGVLSKNLNPEDKKTVSEKLNQVFEEADETWHEDLKRLIGAERARKIIEQIDAVKFD